MGKPVIATAYSGNVDFTWPSNSLPVEYERVAITQDLPFYPRGSVWAEPSVAQAAAHMRWVYEHQEDARALGGIESDLRGTRDARRWHAHGPGDAIDAAALGGGDGVENFAVRAGDFEFERAEEMARG